VDQRRRCGGHVRGQLLRTVGRAVAFPRWALHTPPSTAIMRATTDRTCSRRRTSAKPGPHLDRPSLARAHQRRPRGSLQREPVCSPAPSSGSTSSLDGGTSWQPLHAHLPATTIGRRDRPSARSGSRARDARSQLLRLDDITPLQQLSAAVLAKTEHLFRPRGAILWDEDKRSWHGGGDELWRAGIRRTRSSRTT
jgi:hypothetical protein